MLLLPNKKLLPDKMKCYNLKLDKGGGHCLETEKFTIII